VNFLIKPGCKIVHLQLEKSVRSVGLNNRQIYLTEQEEMQIKRLIVRVL